ISLERNLWSVGAFGGVVLNNHIVDFHALPTIPSCCPDYKSGFGTRLSIGGLFDYQISKKYNLSLELRTAFNNLGGTLKAEEKLLMFYDPETSVEGIIEHNIETSINSISFDPIVKLGLFENSSLHLGMSFGVITSTHFTQRETFIEPKDLVFANDQRERMVYSGAIPNATGLYTSFTVGINYDIMLSKNKNWFLSPELFLNYGLNNIIKSEKWNVLSVRLALALNYNGSVGIIRTHEQFREIDTIKIENPVLAENIFMNGQPILTYDTLKFENIVTIRENYCRTDTLMTKPEYNFNVSLNTTALEKSGNEIKLSNIKVEEFLATEMEPLLNYVFFDSNSFEIPERYKLLDSKEIENFSTFTSFAETDHNAIEFYYNILNIIGFRMRQSPGANLTLVGCNMDLFSEKNNMTISKNRAQAVKDYLSNIWKIDSKRIIVKARNLPEVLSNNKTSEGNEENRRVEISSDDLKIISPVIANTKIIETSLKDNIEKEKKLNVGGFRFYTAVTPGIQIKKWKLSVIQEADTVKTFDGTGSIPASFDWYLSKRVSVSKLLLKPLKFCLTATDSKNKDAFAQDIPEIELLTLDSKQSKNQRDIVIDTYSTMLFEYGSSKLKDNDLPKRINRDLSKDAKIKVLGYSDKLGDDNFNLKLSTARAKAVSEAIGHPNSTYQGFGESIQLHNNDLPEGRFYSRNVDIIVESPIQW
ncbi:MAG: OmpA family protein, partial [Bacteroidota bacterium]